MQIKYKSVKHTQKHKSHKENFQVYSNMNISNAANIEWWYTPKQIKEYQIHK